MKVVIVNMGCVLKEMVESILFGYECGVFIGVVVNKVGFIEIVYNGLFFLDEIGECFVLV